jgi:hypothetical protein
MADVYATITAADEETLRRLAEILELRASDPQQRAMREDYIADLELLPGARVLEVGCGTADEAVASFVHDPWLLRRIAALVVDAGFEDCRVRGHAYTTTDAEYMLALVDRGADALAATGRLASDTAEALKAEARARRQAGSFFGHIAYVSAIATHASSLLGATRGSRDRDRSGRTRRSEDFVRRRHGGRARSAGAARSPSTRAARVSAGRARS